MRGDRERAITDLRAMRQTHVEWLEHLRPGIIKDQPHCLACAESGVEHVVGDAAHHEACIEKYDNALEVLGAPLPDRSPDAH